MKRVGTVFAIVFFVSGIFAIGLALSSSTAPAPGGCDEEMSFSMIPVGRGGKATAEDAVHERAEWFGLFEEHRQELREEGGGWFVAPGAAGFHALQNADGTWSVVQGYICKGAR